MNFQPPEQDDPRDDDQRMQDADCAQRAALGSEAVPELLKMAVDKVVNDATDRLMGWRLPADFYPDCYISFDTEKALQMHSWPTGTNLLHVGQARAMFEYCLSGLAETLVTPQPVEAKPVALIAPELTEFINIQEAWEAAGGNPGIKATRKDLLLTLTLLDQIADEADTSPIPQPVAREPLTSEQLREIARQYKANTGHRLQNHWDEVVAFARDVELAHGIKPTSAKS